MNAMGRRRRKMLEFSFPLRIERKTKNSFQNVRHSKMTRWILLNEKMEIIFSKKSKFYFDVKNITEVNPRNVTHAYTHPNTRIPTTWRISVYSILSQSQNFYAKLNPKEKKIEDRIYLFISNRISNSLICIPVSLRQPRCVNMT